MATRFVANPRAGEQLKASLGVRKAVTIKSGVAAQMAQAIAPVGGADDPHRGQFKKSIKAVMTPTGARVVTTDPEGNLKEFGSVHNPPSFTIRKAVLATIGPIR